MKKLFFLLTFLLGVFSINLQAQDTLNFVVNYSQTFCAGAQPSTVILRLEQQDGTFLDQISVNYIGGVPGAAVSMNGVIRWDGVLVPNSYSKGSLVGNNIRNTILTSTVTDICTGGSTYTGPTRGVAINKSGAGSNGTSGVDGKSAYQLWLDLGNTGTNADYQASLVGPSGLQGPIGPAGVNCYDGLTDLNGDGNIDVLDCSYIDCTGLTIPIDREEIKSNLDTINWQYFAGSGCKLDSISDIRKYTQDINHNCELVEKEDSIVITSDNVVTYQYVINAKCEYDTIIDHKSINACNFIQAKPLYSGVLWSRDYNSLRQCALLNGYDATIPFAEWSYFYYLRKDQISIPDGAVISEVQYDLNWTDGNTYSATATDSSSCTTGSIEGQYIVGFGVQRIGGFQSNAVYSLDVKIKTNLGNFEMSVCMLTGGGFGNTNEFVFPNFVTQNIDQNNCTGEVQVQFKNPAAGFTYSNYEMILDGVSHAYAASGTYVEPIEFSDNLNIPFDLKWTSTGNTNGEVCENSFKGFIVTGNGAFQPISNFQISNGNVSASIGNQDTAKFISISPNLIINQEGKELKFEIKSSVDSIFIGAIGQSNMSGVCGTAGRRECNDNVIAWNGSGYQSACSLFPRNYIDLQAANRLQEQTKKVIVLFHQSASGTSITEFQNTGSQRTAFNAQLAAAGNPKLSTIWIAQGESDMLGVVGGINENQTNEDIAANNYYNAFYQLRSELLQEDYFIETTTMIINEILETNTQPNSINKAISKIECDSVNVTGMVPARFLSACDAAHFDDGGIDRLGVLYANKTLSLPNNQVKSSIRFEKYSTDTTNCDVAIQEKGGFEISRDTFNCDQFAFTGEKSNDWQIVVGGVNTGSDLVEGLTLNSVPVTFSEFRGGTTSPNIGEVLFPNGSGSQVLALSDPISRNQNIRVGFTYQGENIIVGIRSNIEVGTANFQNAHYIYSTNAQLWSNTNINNGNSGATIGDFVEIELLVDGTINYYVNNSNVMSSNNTINLTETSTQNIVDFIKELYGQ